MRVLAILAMLIGSPPLFAGETFEDICPGFENKIAEDMRVPPNEFNKANVLDVLERLERNPEHAIEVDLPELGAKGAQRAWLIRGYVLRSEFRVAKSKSEAEVNRESKAEWPKIVELRRQAFCEFLVEEGSYR
jgi:hypothetical protein